MLSVSFCTAAVHGRRLPKPPQAFQKVDFSLDQLKQEKKKVAQIGDKKILLVEENGEVFAVSNRCSHLNLPLQGRIVSPGLEAGPCVTCSFHGTKFDMRTGEVVGDWCPKMPTLPLVGKFEITQKSPLPSYAVKVEEDGQTIMVDA